MDSRSPKKLTLQVADRIANSAIQCGKENKFNPFTVVVVDPSGNIIIEKKMDGCQTVGIPKFALTKAQACAVTKISSRAFRDKYTAADDCGKYTQMMSMVAISGDSMMPCPGGVVIKNADGAVLGAVGVSGASGDEDEFCAMVGALGGNPNFKISPDKDSCTTKINGVSIEGGKLLGISTKTLKKSV